MNLLFRLFFLSLILTPLTADELKPSEGSESSKAKEKSNNKNQKPSKKKIAKKPKSRKKHKDFTDLTLDLNQLKTWRSLRYSFEKKAGPAPKGMALISFWVFKTKIEKDRILLEDSEEIIADDPEEIDGKKIFKVICQKDNFLSPISAEYTKVDEFGEALEYFEATFKDKKMTVEYESEKKSETITEEVKDNSIFAYSLFRIISLLPKKKGDKFKINYLPAMSVSAGKETYVHCDGPSTLGKIKCTKFRVPVEKTSLFFWVDEQGVIQKISDQRATIQVLLISDSKNESP